MDTMLGKLVRLIVTVPAERLGTLCDVSEKLASEAGEDWVDNLKLVLRKEFCSGINQVTEVTAPKPAKSILRLLTPNLIIRPTDGKRTLAEATDIFPGGIYGVSCGDSSEARSETLVDVHELIENATLRQMFEGQGVPLDQLFCLTPDQVIQFIVDHRKRLQPKGYATLFPFKVGENPFVASVRWYDGRWLRVYVYHFSYDSVWGAGARLRVVLPRLDLKPSA